MHLSKEKVKEIAHTVIDTEMHAVAKLHNYIDEQFLRACELLADCSGRIIFIGMGKSGHIAKKLSSTFSSVGNASIYIHPSEAGHGDIGMVQTGDLICAVSYSGETDEIKQLLPALKNLNTPLIALTGSTTSTLAKNADIVVNVCIEKEACQLGLAPTSSTTATLAMGDAIAIVLQKEKDFTSKDFAKSHPAGHLGRKLTVKISDVMRVKDEIPQIPPKTSLLDTLCEISLKGLGMTLIVENNKALGIFTDGDLRRALESNDNIREMKVADFMTHDFYSATADQLAYDVLKDMRNKSINSIPVLDEKGNLIGALNMHDILSAGF